MKLLPPARAGRVHAVMSAEDVVAATLMSDRFQVFSKETKVAEVLAALRALPRDRRNIAYLYIALGEEKILQGVVDLRDVAMAAPETTLGELMVAPLVTADRDALREDLIKSFAKYHFRMLPVVDAHDHLLGIVRYKDLMQGVKLTTGS